MTRDTTEVLDARALLADLEAWWAAPQPPGFSGSAPKRIAGGKYDQQVPEGTQNPYWDLIRQLPLDDIAMPWHARPEPMLHWLSNSGDSKYFADRFTVCSAFSWAICSPGDVAWLREVLDGRGVVEVGAGTGYWAWQMRQAGIDVIAYEPNEPKPGNTFVRREWTEVLRGDQFAAKAHPDRALFLCWPSYNEPWAAEALAAYSGDLLVYCGEGEGGCTADGEFFRLLEDGWEEIGDSGAHVAHWGIHDYLTAYRRKDAQP